MIHYASHDYIGKLPHWLLEGLAEYYESCDIQGKQIKVYSQDGENHTMDRVGYLANLKKQGKLPSVNDFMKLPDSYWETHNKLMYSMSWAIVKKIVESKSGKETLRKMLETKVSGPS